MDFCGKIYVSKDLSSFSLKCSNCNNEITKWFEFQRHIKQCLVSKREIENLQDEVMEIPINAIDESKYSILESIEIIEPAALANISIKEEDDDMPLSFLRTSGAKEGREHLDVWEDIDMNQGFSDFDDDIKDEIKKENGNEELGNSSMGHTEWNEDLSASESGDSCDDSSSSEFQLNSNSKGNSKNNSKFIVSFHRKDQTTGFFIDLYKQHPCLWNSNDAKYNDKKAHSEARKAMMATIFKKHKVELSERKIKETIEKIRQQYYETRELYTTNPKSNLLKSLAIMHYKRCMFLGQIEKPKLKEETTTGVKSKKDAGFKAKFKIFSHFGKEFVDAFIELYKRCPELYDRNHPSYQNNMLRREVHMKMIEELNTNHGTNLTLESLITYITSLRHWYHSTTKKHKKSPESLCEEEQSYFDKCQFMPDYIKQATIVCSHCKSTFKSMINYQKHLYSKHQVGEAVKFECDHCDRVFDLSTSLTLHIQRHHSGKNFVCEFCNHRFSIKADWKLHLRCHTNEKPYICEQCGKAFRLRNQLGSHVTTMHKRERAFQCNMCPKNFYKKAHLTDHIKAHLNIRDKICPTCGKGFTNSHSLCRHRQIHSEIKKFQCKLCDAKFHQFVGLNSHMKRTHGIFKNKPAAE